MYENLYLKIQTWFFKHFNKSTLQPKK